MLNGIGKDLTLVRILSFVSHWTGQLYLSAFVMNTGLVWFILRKSFSCTFHGAGVVYVDCGETAFDQFLDIFFLYASPLVAPLTAFYWRYLFHFPLEATQSQFTFLFLYFPLSVFVMVSSLLVLRQMIKGFILRKREPARAKRSWRILTVLLLPALLASTYHLYLVPPQWIAKDVTVDAWHGTFNVPRGELKDWSVIVRPRPDKRPNEYSGRLTRWWRSVPYLTFNYPLKDGVGEQMLEINVNPHYDVLNRKEMEEARQKLAGYKTKLVSEFDHTSVYRRTPRGLDRWQIYDAGTFAEDVFPDIYIARNPDNTIAHILQCTPSNACAVKTRYRWMNYPCGDKMSCDVCNKVCSDISMGTENYDINYTFYKDDLDRYFEFNDDIQRRIASYFTPKN